MENFEGFILDRTAGITRNDSNCVGTALYLIGEMESDKYISRNESKKILAKMKRAIKPELGYLVLWESDGIPFHAGVVVMENPFYILYRNKKTKLLTKDSLEKFICYLFKETKLKPVYRIPNKLLDEIK